MIRVCVVRRGGEANPQRSVQRAGQRPIPGTSRVSLCDTCPNRCSGVLSPKLLPPASPPRVRLASGPPPPLNRGRGRCTAPRALLCRLGMSLRRLRTLDQIRTPPVHGQLRASRAPAAPPPRTPPVLPGPARPHKEVPNGPILPHFRSSPPPPNTITATTESLHLRRVCHVWANSPVSVRGTQRPPALLEPFQVALSFSLSLSLPDPSQKRPADPTWPRACNLCERMWGGLWQGAETIIDCRTPVVY